MFSTPELHEVYQYNGMQVAAVYAAGRLKLINLNNFSQVLDINVQLRVNAISFNEYHVVLATENYSIHVHETKTTEMKYVLLGGSMNPKTIPKSFVRNPRSNGCNGVFIDNERIVGVFGNLIRVYHFDLD